MYSQFWKETYSSPSHYLIISFTLLLCWLLLILASFFPGRQFAEPFAWHETSIKSARTFRVVCLVTTSSCSAHFRSRPPHFPSQKGAWQVPLVDPLSARRGRYNQRLLQSLVCRALSILILKMRVTVSVFIRTTTSTPNRLRGEEKTWHVAENWDPTEELRTEVCPQGVASGWRLRMSTSSCESKLPFAKQMLVTSDHVIFEDHFESSQCLCFK